MAIRIFSAIRAAVGGRPRPRGGPWTPPPAPFVDEDDAVPGIIPDDDDDEDPVAWNLCIREADSEEEIPLV